MRSDSPTAYSAKQRRGSGADLICLYGKTAMEFWRNAQVMEARVIDAYAKAGSCPGEDELVLTNYLEGRRIPLAACGTPSLKRDFIEHIAGRYMLTLPLKLVVGDKRDTRRGNLANAHAVAALKDVEEFIYVNQDLAVTSPSLCACSEAESLDEVGLAVLISEICSSYVIDISETCLRARKLANKLEIQECGSTLAKLSSKHMQGRGQKILEILEFTIENLYSPREMILQQLLCLPKRLGGFGLPLPEANCKIALNAKQKCLTGRNIVMPDLYWKRAGICIEYDGAGYHCSPEQIDNDKTKQAILEELGITTLHADNATINNVAATRDIASLIAQKIGFKLRTRGELFGEKHLILRKRLLRT